MPEDILPPLPPGEKPKISKREKEKKLEEEKGWVKEEKKEKKGFLASLFRKKKKEVSEPPTITSATPTTPEVPLDINLDEIRKNLGLDSALSEVAEPGKIGGKKEEKEEARFELPDIEEPPELMSREEPEVPEEEVVEEPPKIKPKRKAPKKKLEKKLEEKKEVTKKKLEKKKTTPKKKSEEKKAKPVLVSKEPSGTKGAREGEPEKGRKSEFLEEVKPRIELLKEPPKEDFLREVPPDEVKELAKALKRKRFAEEKGVEYEPAVGFAEETPKEEMLIDESPEDEVKEIKKRIKQGLVTEEKPAKLVEKKEVREQEVDVGKLAPPRLEEESSQKEKVTHATRLIKAVEADLRDKIRKEELAKLEKEFAAQRKKLEEDVRLVEQQKIRVAGMMNKYDFKIKQFRKEKDEFRKEKEQFKKEKAQARELLKKLPGLRKDYNKLMKRMREINDKIKEYKKAEETLLSLEKEIRSKEEALEKAQQVLKETENKIKEKGFADYLETELKGGSIVSPKFKEKDILKASHLDMYNMVDECKALIRQGDVTGAKRLYMKLRDAYNAAKLKKPDKDLLHTAIRELYDDIKLAEMEQSGL